MPLTKEGTIDERLDRLVEALEKSPASYLINGKSKWTTSILVTVFAALIVQAVMGAWYLAKEAPTKEWVDQRIVEKMFSMPITAEAQLRITRTEDGLRQVQNKLDTVHDANIRTSVKLEGLTDSVDKLTQELKMVGFGRSAR